MLEDGQAGEMEVDNDQAGLIKEDAALCSGRRPASTTW